MKYEIDTDLKTIKVLGEISLNELFKQVKILFPDNKWKEYTLSQVTEIVWKDPIIIEKSNPWIQPYQPWISTTGYDITIKGDKVGTTSEVMMNNPCNQKAHTSYCVEIN